MPNVIGLFGTAYGVSVVAGIAGIGGGGMLIPLYAIIANIDLRSAIILSVITIAGNTFIRGIYYIFKRHRATRRRVMINYNISRLVVPFIGISSYIGFLLNQALPQFVIFLTIVLILGILILKLIKKTYLYFKKNPDKDNMYVIDDTFVICNNTDLADRRGDSKTFIINNLLFTISSFLVTAFFSYLIRNTESIYMRICYYIVQVVILLLSAHINIVHINDIYKQRKAKPFNWLQGDICWAEKKNYVKFGIAGLFTGFFSSMLGIGGSMILNPIMVDLQVLPDVVVATSSLLSFFASIIAVILYMGDTTMFLWYLPILFILGGLGGITGIFIINYFKKNIRLIILIILISCMVGSLILLCIHQIFIFIDL